MQANNATDMSSYSNNRLAKLYFKYVMIGFAILLLIIALISYWLVLLLKGEFDHDYVNISFKAK